MIRMVRYLSLFLAFLVMAPMARLAAQEPAGAAQTIDTARAPSEVDIERADISISASVTARELTFQTAGESSVSFHGTMNRDTIHFSEEINIPPLIQVGRTYRDIGVRLVITSAFADIDRIVAEALGEIPIEEERNEQERRNDTKGEKR